MDRLYQEISELAPLLDSAKHHICLVKLAPPNGSSVLNNTGMQERNQTIPFSCVIMASSKNPVRSLRKVCRKNEKIEWFLFQNLYFSILPHAQQIFWNSIQNSPSMAYIAGESYWENGKETGCFLGNGEVYGSDDPRQQGASNLLLHRNLLLRCLDCTEKFFENRFLIFALRERIGACGEKIHFIRKLLFKTDDAFCFLPSLFPRPRTKKRILAFSHEFSLTGAPIVFRDALRVLQKNEYQIHVVSLLDGAVLELLAEDGMSVSVDQKLESRSDEYWMQIAEQYDAVFVSTIVGYWLADRMGKYGVPVFWWIHDAEIGYPYLSQFLPQQIPSCVHIYCGGAYARKILQKYRPLYPAENLLYGIQDRYGIQSGEYPLNKGGKTLFSTIGSIEERKGQSILLQAIEKLPQKILDDCLFLIVGRALDREHLAYVQRMEEKYPENVRYLQSIPRDKIDSVYRQTDCIICASTDDPMPVFVAEGWMCGTPCICSENTGTAPMITDGVDGLIYHDNDPERLAEKIVFFHSLPAGERASLKTGARNLFTENFDWEQFEKKLLALTAELTDEEWK